MTTVFQNIYNNTKNSYISGVCCLQFASGASSQIAIDFTAKGDLVRQKNKSPMKSLKTLFTIETLFF